MKKITTLLLFLFFGLTLMACAKNLGDGTAKLATEIGFKSEIITGYVDDVITLDQSIINIQPLNSAISRHSISNPDVAQLDIDTMKLTLLSVGNATLTIYAQSADDEISASITLSVIEKPNYAIELLPEKTSVTFNYDVAGFNELKIKLDNNDVVDFADFYDYAKMTEENFVVSYNSYGSIEYDVFSGRIVLAEGVSVYDIPSEIKVSLTLKQENRNDLTSEFNVKITNYNFMQSLEVFAYGVKDSISLNEVIELKTNSTLVLLLNPTPTNYNQGYTITSSSNNVTIKGYELKVLDKVENGTKISIKYKTNTDITEVFEFLINTREELNLFEIDVLDLNDKAVSELIVSDAFDYKIRINANIELCLDNIVKFSDLAFYDIEVRDNELLLRANSKNNDVGGIKLYYKETLFNSVISMSSNELFYDVYENNTGFDLYAQYGSASHKVTDNSLSLFVIDNNYADLAEADSVAYYANINVVNKNNNAKKDNYDVLVENESGFTKLKDFNDNLLCYIELTDDGFVVSSKSEGSIKIMIISKDSDKVSYMLNVVFENSVVDNIIVPSEFNTSLYLNVSEENKTIMLSELDLSVITAHPLYAVNKNITFELNNGNTSINGNKLVANNVGTSVLTVKAGQKTAAINVTVESAITDVDLSFNCIDSHTVNELGHYVVTISGLVGKIDINVEILRNTLKISNYLFDVSVYDKEFNPISETQIFDRDLRGPHTNSITFKLIGYGTEVLKYRVQEHNKVFEGTIVVNVLTEYANVEEIVFEHTDLYINVYDTLEIFNDVHFITTDNRQDINYSLLIIHIASKAIKVTNLNCVTIDAYEAMLIIGSTVKVVFDYDGALYSYNVTLSYVEPKTTIKEITFEHQNIAVNLYESNNVTENAFTVLLENENLTTDQTIEFNSADTNYVVVNKYSGQVEIVVGYVAVQTDIEIIVSVMENNVSIKSFSYTITLYYEVVYDAITSVEFAGGNEATVNIDDTFASVSDELIINNGADGLYDINLIEIAEIDVEVVYEIQELTYTFTFTAPGNYVIVLRVVNTDILYTYRVTVTNYNYIYTNSDFAEAIGTDSEYVLANDLVLDTAYFNTPSRVLNAVIDLNGFTVSNVYKTMFVSIGENGVVKNGNIIVDITSSYGETIITGIATTNFGQLINLNVVVNVNINALTFGLYSGLVHENKNIISNINLNIFAKNNASMVLINTTEFYAVAHTNNASITNLKIANYDVLRAQEQLFVENFISGFSKMSSCVHINNSLIENLEINIEFYGAKIADTASTFTKQILICENMANATLKNVSINANIRNVVSSVYNYLVLYSNNSYYENVVAVVKVNGATEVSMCSFIRGNISSTLTNCLLNNVAY